MAILTDRIAETERADAARKKLAPPTIKTVSLPELLAMELPQRETLLTPWLPAQGLALIHAMRGIGKTHLSLGIGYAVASGSSFMRWTAPAPRGVLFIDGEMPAGALQERLAQIATASGKEPGAPFRIITPDLQEFGVPDLSTQEGQELIDAAVTDDIALLIVDNLSCLCRSGRENEAESWQPVQTWALRHRARGRSVLFIHHSGKGGNQRGTSRREDVLDSVITLRRPPDYAPKDGAHFEIHFEKTRHFYGQDADPFDARLTEGSDGRLVWTIRDLDETRLERIARMLNDGLSQKDISIEMGIAKSTVSYHTRRAKELGLVVLKGGADDDK